jgi:hypothetical protein
VLNVVDPVREVLMARGFFRDVIVMCPAGRLESPEGSCCAHWDIEQPRLEVPPQDDGF